MNDKYKTLNDGGYNNLLIVVLVVVVIYLFITGFTKSKQQTYLDNAGTDVNTQQAQALRDAFNRSGISYLMGVDGTDTDLVFQTAAQITDYKLVSDAYRVLYNSELTTDLQSELSRTDLAKFWSIVYKTTPTTGTTATNSGKSVIANTTVNIRSVDAPYSVVSDIVGKNKQAKKGDILGIYFSEMVLPNIPNKGDKNVFVKYVVPTFFGLINPQYYVLKSAVTIK